jgi:hypothetical protein
MHSRAAEAEIVAMSGPTPGWPEFRAAVSRFPDGTASVTPRIAGQTEEVDACLYIFGLCKELQTTWLDRRGIDCLLDGDGAGRLSEAVCRMLGLMVCELVKDASERTIAPRTITVTLRRRGDVCLCTISGRGIADPSADLQPGLRRVRELAAELDGGCMIRRMPEPDTIAIMFDAHLVEPRLPAAIWWYRTAAEARRASGPIPTVAE